MRADCNESLRLRESAVAHSVDRGDSKVDRMLAAVLRFGPLPAVVAGQALLLAGLGVVLDRGVWPADNPVVLVPLITSACAWPALVLFTAESGSFRRTTAFAGGCTIVAVLLAAYVGRQAMPVGEFSVELLYAMYAATVLAAGFIALAFLQQFVAREPVRYAALFQNAWRNLLVAGLSLALLGGVAVLFALWAVLFQVLGIDTLAEMFTELWFVLPAAGIVFGMGTILFGRRNGLVDGIVGLLEGLARYLLPVVLLIVAVFLVTLPFVGVGALWDTGLGSSILVALCAIAVLLICIVYRPGAGLRYPGPVQASVAAAVAALPVLPALALAGILIRVHQYGWTVARCWAFTFAAILALFSLGYLGGVIRHRAAWPRIAAAVNVSMACVILAVMLLQNTPVLDFRAISTRSQLARVESGEIDAAQFDFQYVRRELARPGHLAAEQLVAGLGFDPRDREPDVVPPGPKNEPGTGSGGGMVFRASPDDVPDRDFWADVSFRPEPFAVPDGVREAIDREAYIAYRIEQPILVRTELDRNSDRAEYLLLGLDRVEFPGWRELPPSVSFLPLAYAIVDPGDGWKFVTLFESNGRAGSDNPEAVLGRLRNAPIDPVRPRYDHVRIGDRLYGLTRVWSRNEARSAADGNTP